MEDRGVELLVRLNPLPIEVNTCQVAAGVTIYDTVWVKHRDDLEHKVVPQNAGS